MDIDLNLNKPKRRLVFGDTHGGLKALEEVLELCNFNEEEDLLIGLGDVVDGWADSFKLVNYLIDLQIRCEFEPIFLRGNHDAWLEEFLVRGFPNPGWLANGGKSTLSAYQGISEEDRKKHSFFFRYLHNHYLSDDNIAFVHGGYVGHGGLKDAVNSPSDFYWDRSLLQVAVNHQAKFHDKKDKYDEFYPKILKPHKEIYVGHTNTLFFGSKVPFQACNLWNLDTAAGYKGGKLTIMDVDSKKYWQSPLLEELYPTDPHTLYGRQ